jgi:hypothetical protein
VANLGASEYHATLMCTCIYAADRFNFYSTLFLSIGVGVHFALEARRCDYPLCVYDLYCRMRLRASCSYLFSPFPNMSILHAGLICIISCKTNPEKTHALSLSPIYSPRGFFIFFLFLFPFFFSVTSSLSLTANCIYSRCGGVQRKTAKNYGTCATAIRECLQGVERILFENMPCNAEPRFGGCAY